VNLQLKNSYLQIKICNGGKSGDADDFIDIFWGINAF
jgi:hypothetical protein